LYGRVAGGGGGGGMTDHGDHARLVYTGMAAVAGAITALSFMKWREMSWPEVMLTIFVGAAFALFAVPWIAADWAGMDLENLRAICGVTYLGATGSNILIPVAIRRFRAAVGGEDAA
jgi:hypothetical protein